MRRIKAAEIKLSEKERQILKEWSRSRSSQRCRIVVFVCPLPLVADVIYPRSLYTVAAFPLASVLLVLRPKPSYTYCAVYPDITGSFTVSTRFCMS